MFGVSAIAGIHSFSEHGGKRGRVGAPAVAQPGHGLRPTARSPGVRPGYGEDDDFTAVQEGQGAVAAAGGVTRREAHGNSAGGPRVSREATPRGVCDQTGEIFRAAASAAERAAS